MPATLCQQGLRRITDTNALEAMWGFIDARTMHAGWSLALLRFHYLASCSGLGSNIQYRTSHGARLEVEEADTAGSPPRRHDTNPP
jgi:hypothetical protein